MIDPRYSQLAELLVKECVSTKPGDHVWIAASGIESLPLAREVFKVVVAMGAHPLYELRDTSVDPYFYKYASPEQLNHHPDVMEFTANLADRIIRIVAEPNRSELATVDSQKFLAREKPMRAVREIMLAKPWVLTYVPTHGLAQDANMSFDEFEDFYFGATLRDWPAVENRLEALAKRLTKGKKLEIVGERTHLTMSIKGKTWIFDDWKANMPGGEVFTSPVADSVSGTIYFSYPRVFQGRLIRDIELTFEKGRVVAARASENQDLLEKILDTDADARRLGEVAIGGNPGITEYINNMLFDEKIQGTIHCALGQGFTECGGETTSAIHMDLVKNMRSAGSTILCDGEAVFADGKILVE